MPSQRSRRSWFWHDVHHASVRQACQVGDGEVAGGGVQRDHLAGVFVFPFHLGEERQDGGMGPAGQYSPQYGLGKVFEALLSALLDLGVGIVQQGKEHAREFDRLQREGTARGHASNRNRRIASHIFFRLWAQGEANFLGLGF